MHREGIPALGLSLEKATENVPNDGAWHIVRSGEIVASFPLERKARKEYRKIRDELIEQTGYETGHEPLSPQEVLRREALERELGELQAEASRSKRAKALKKGGKGGSGGV